MFENYKETELEEIIINANKELLKRYCSRVIHCEKCPYIYDHEECEIQHLINFARSGLDA